MNGILYRVTFSLHSHPPVAVFYFICKQYKIIVLIISVCKSKAVFFYVMAVSWNIPSLQLSDVFWDLGKIDEACILLKNMI